jgi:hypothetical protein
MADTRIDERQAATWAQEQTLKDLLLVTKNTNSAILKYVGEKLGDETLKEIQRGNNIAQRGIQEAKKSADDFRTKSDLKLKDAFADLQKEMKYTIQGIKKSLSSGDFEGALSNTGEALKQSSKSVFEVTRGFGTTGRVLGTVTAGLMAYVGVTATLLTVMNSLNSEFGKLYESGINVRGGLTGLTSASMEIGITTGELVTTFTQFGAAVTSLGTDRTLKLAKDFTKLRSETSALGLTNQGAVEALLEYTELQRQNGLLSSMTNDELIKGTKEYYAQITAVSAVTGKQRKEIERGIRARAADLDYQLVLRSLPKEMQKNIQKTMNQMEQLGPAGAKAAQDVVTSVIAGKGVAGLDAATRNALNASGLTDTFQSMADKASKGMDVTDEMDRIAQRLGDPAVLENFRGLAKVPGAGGDMARKIIEMAQSTDSLRNANAELEKIASAQFDKTTQREQWEAAKDAARKERDGRAAAENKRTLDAQKALSQATATLQGMLQNLAINVLQPMLPVFTLLADVVSLAAKAFAIIPNALKSITSPFVGETGGNIAGAAGALATAGGAYYGYKKIKEGPIGDRIGTMLGRRKGAPQLPGAGGAPQLPGAGGETGAVLETIAQAGPTMGDTLKSLAGGLSAFNPAALKGAVILGASIAAIITGLGAGIAAASFLIGKTLPTLAEGMKSFQDVDGEKLGSTALGITKLSGALVLFGGANVVNAFGAIAGAISSFFGQDPLTKLRGFADIGEPLATAGNSMQQFANVYPKAIQAINEARFDPTGLQGLERLRAMFQGEGFFSSLGKGIANMLGQGDFMTQITRFSDSSAKIDGLSSALVKFSSSYAQLADSMSRPIPQETLNSLQRAVDLSNRVSEKKGLFSRMFGGKAEEAPAPASESVVAAPPQYSNENVNKKTIEYYESSSSINQRMLDLLAMANEKLDNIERATRDGSSEVSKSLSGKLY